MSKFKFEIMENWLIRVIIKLGGVKMKTKSELDRELGRCLAIRISLQRNISIEIFSYSLNRCLKESEMTKGKVYRINKMKKYIEKLTLKINNIKKELQKYKN